MTRFGAAVRWLWASSLAASFGNGIERTTTAWLAFEAGGAAAVGVVLAVRMLPSLLFGLAAGTITDRVDRRVTAVISGCWLRRSWPPWRGGSQRQRRGLASGGRSRSPWVR